MENTEKETRGGFGNLLAETGRIAAGSRDDSGKLQNICDLLRKSVPHYDWVGFYVADAPTKTLRLGPFSGAPTQHARIAFGQGICGQAAERKETFVVRDVSKEANYLSCSVHVKSEIVVPVMRDGEVVAELDIDSHTRDVFTAKDRVFLEKVAGTVSCLF
jgi:GAF domain-containing protein